MGRSSPHKTNLSHTKKGRPGMATLCPSGRDIARAEVAQGTPTHSHISPSILGRESRRCSRDTYPAACVTNYTSIGRCVVAGPVVDAVLVHCLQPAFGFDVSGEGSQARPVRLEMLHRWRRVEGLHTSLGGVPREQKMLKGRLPNIAPSILVYEDMSSLVQWSTPCVCTASSLRCFLMAGVGV